MAICKICKTVTNSRVGICTACLKKSYNRDFLQYVSVVLVSITYLVVIAYLA